MKPCSDQHISDILRQLEQLCRNYPSGPFQRAFITIKHLQIACARLRARGTVGADNPAAQTRPARRRRTPPKHPHGTPAYVRIMANMEVDSNTGCWVWLGSGTDNHGTISSEKSKNDLVHRVMFEHANARPLKDGEVVRHTCDNGFCCNPEHLVVGTQKENAQDRSSRRRGGVQKLSYSEAKEILIRRREGESPTVLAIEYGMSAIGISHVGRRSFKHLNDDPDVVAVQVALQGRRKLTTNQVIEIKRLLEEGTAHEVIARKHRVTEAYIGDIASGRRWSSLD